MISQKQEDAMLEGCEMAANHTQKKASACAVQAEVQIGSLCCVSYDYCSTNLVLLQIWPVLRRIKDICLMKMLDKTRSAGIIPRKFNFA